MPLEGEMVIAGIPVERIAGSNLNEKRNLVLHTASEGIEALVAAGGYCFKQTITSVAVLPTGFLHIVASKGCKGIRWSLSSDAGDRARVITMLGDFVANFQEARNPSSGNPQFLEFLQCLAV